MGIWENILVTSVVSIILVVVMLLIYWFFSTRGMKHQKDHYTQLHQELKPGKKVQFSNGLYGTVTRVGQETVDIQVKSGAVIEVSRYAVTEVL